MSGCGIGPELDKGMQQAAQIVSIEGRQHNTPLSPCPQEKGLPFRCNGRDGYCPWNRMRAQLRETNRPKSSLSLKFFKMRKESLDQSCVP